VVEGEGAGGAARGLWRGTAACWRVCRTFPWAPARWARGGGRAAAATAAAGRALVHALALALALPGDHPPHATLQGLDAAQRAQ